VSPQAFFSLFALKVSLGTLFLAARNPEIGPQIVKFAESACVLSIFNGGGKQRLIISVTLRPNYELLVQIS